MFFYDYTFEIFRDQETVLSKFLAFEFLLSGAGGDAWQHQVNKSSHDYGCVRPLAPTINFIS